MCIDGSGTQQFVYIKIKILRQTSVKICTANIFDKKYYLHIMCESVMVV